jgi:hypothetical protein
MLLIIFLENSFKLVLCQSIYIHETIVIDGISYKMDETSKKNEGFIGFFDWLRVNEKTIIGIRLSYFDYLKYTALFLDKPYTKGVFENRSIELLFKECDFDFELSGDQDFTNNYVYESHTGEHLCTFGLDHLTKEEYDSLLKYCKTFD